MKFEFRLTGVDRLEARMKEICARLPEAVRSGAIQAAEDTRKLAMKLAPGGAVRKTITAELMDTETGSVISSRVFNDTSKAFWSSYVEFGTGLKVDNEGITDAIRLKRAKKIPWYIHVSMVPESFARYGYPRVGDFWEVDGMYPNPYMKPAGFQRRDANTKEITNALHTMFEEVGI